MVIGITGGSGSGKSYISKIFSKHGFGIVDADKISKEIMNVDQELKNRLIQKFGTEILVDGKIYRKRLGMIVFADKEKLETLNKLTHPAIIKEIRKQMKSFDNCILDVPLLVGSELIKDCDCTVSIIADTDIRLKRIIERDKIDELTAINRINSQLSNEEYKKNTDYCIINNGKEDIDSQVKYILESELPKCKKV